MSTRVPTKQGHADVSGQGAPHLRTVTTVHIVGYGDQSRLHKSTVPLTTYKFKVYENKWLQIL